MGSNNKGSLFDVGRQEMKSPIPQFGNNDSKAYPANFKLQRITSRQPQIIDFDPNISENKPIDSALATLT
jgi:hypothetical protein